MRIVLTPFMRARTTCGLVLTLAIVDDLAVSDRSPGELGERHGLSANLLAHHLDVLEAAGDGRWVLQTVAEYQRRG